MVGSISSYQADTLQPTKRALFHCSDSHPKSLILMAGWLGGLPCKTSALCPSILEEFCWKIQAVVFFGKIYRNPCRNLAPVNFGSSSAVFFGQDSNLNGLHYVFFWFANQIRRVRFVTSRRPHPFFQRCQDAKKRTRPWTWQRLLKRPMSAFVKKGQGVGWDMFFWGTVETFFCFFFGKLDGPQNPQVLISLASKWKDSKLSIAKISRSILITYISLGQFVFV